MRFPWFYVHDLHVHYPLPHKLWAQRGPKPVHRAVQGVQLGVERGEVVGVVGESGCGKSTVARAVLQLIRPTHGIVAVDGVNLTDFWQRAWGRDVLAPAMAPYRQRLQMIFQDPHASLDATQRVGDAIAEPMRIHHVGHRKDHPAHVAALLDEVGLTHDIANRWPHALSGGQRQRVGIARALATQPQMLIADEPTSALDVSVKGHVLFMLEALVARRNLALLFISHDLAAVRYIAHHVVVMYKGRVVESGPVAAVLGAPLHPYTVALMAAATVANPTVQRARLYATATGAALPPLPVVKSDAQNIEGCAYADRCPRRIAQCRVQVPVLLATQTDQRVACHCVHADDAA